MFFRLSELVVVGGVYLALFWVGSRIATKLARIFNRKVGE